MTDRFEAVGRRWGRTDWPLRAAFAISLSTACFFIAACLLAPVGREVDAVAVQLRTAQFAHAKSLLSRQFTAAGRLVEANTSAIARLGDLPRRAEIDRLTDQLADQLEEARDVTFLACASRTGAYSIAERVNAKVLTRRRWLRAYDMLDADPEELPSEGGAGDPPYDPRARPWFEAEDEPAWGVLLPIASRRDPLPALEVVLSRRVRATSGERPGTVAAGLSSATVGGALREVAGSEHVLFVLDRKGQLVASSLDPDSAGYHAIRQQQLSGPGVGMQPVYAADAAEARIREAATLLHDELQQAKSKETYKRRAMIDNVASALQYSKFDGGLTLVMVAAEGETSRMITPGVVVAALGALFALIAAGTGRGAGVPARGSRAPSVLVVDDDPAVRRQTVATLALEHWDATAVASCDEALVAWGLRRFDLVLMDMEMPNRDGCATAAALRARERGSRRATILCLTSLATEEAAARARAAGMDGVLAKPLTLQRLRHEWRRARRRRAADHTSAG